MIANTTEVGKDNSACCLVLLNLLGSKVSFPGGQEYNASLTSYFSQQESETHPLCVISPTTVEDVSTAIRALTSSTSALDDLAQHPGCNFAIRSGGHANAAGAANIANGITIDLRGLNTIELSSDQSTVSVGPGATWGDVYSTLDPLGVSVAGGRAAQVGVGGLTTGGGISYFSPRYGWTCDTVINFQVVLADGSIVNANDEENPDLLFALRGGSNNFGVVTRVDLQAFEQGPIWGGSIYYALSTIDQQLVAFENFNLPDTYDEYSSLIMSFGFAGSQGSAIVNSVEYTKPVENPPAFQPFTELPSLSSTMRIANLTNIAIEQGAFSQNGKRELFDTITVRSSLPMLKEIYHLWNASLAAVENVSGISWALSLEPLPPAIYAHKPPKTNPLGFSASSGSMVVTLLSATWTDKSDDATIEKTARDLFSAIEDQARRLGVYEPFIYLNYAAPWQDPIASYGEDIVERLKLVSKKVDPRGIFQFGVPGGFKILP